MGTTKETKVRDWYIIFYPYELLAKEINPTVTFEDVFEALDKRKCVYKLLDVYDSLIRENIFAELSTIMKVSYEYIYNQWLQCEEVTETITFPNTKIN